MKKKLINLFRVALIAMVSIVTGCKKPDTEAPVISLNGAASLTISLQGTYTELNATAADNKDGALTPTVSGTVNVNHTGTYTITYRAVDAAGNIGTAARTVIVVNDAASMAGTYKCTITGFPFYFDTITASADTNKRICFGKFGNYAGNTHIFVHVANTALDSIVTLKNVLAIQVGNPPADRTFYGTGSISATGFSLTYHELKNATDSIRVETFVKQQ